ncbi:MAG: inositol monophosphatase family protein [Candidatus Limnocylindrales bacterium]|jgi:myo-inositol-1(or 4)-monophosphatase
MRAASTGGAGAGAKARSSRLGRSEAYGAELELAIDLAHQAGRIQMERYERLEEIRAKGPRDVVTEVDHLCEGLVMRAVQERYPDDSFYAEEIGEVAATGAAGSGRVWIVDPLDGTVNYANGIPFFCISIALAAAGRPVIGVVYDPTRDETFTGAIDGPSLRNGEPIHVADKELLEDLVVTLAVGGRGTARKRHAAMKSIRAHRSMGSSALTLSYVACGRFDVYAQGAGLSAWDVAAAGLMAERAGATVTSLEGGPWFDLAYPAKKWSCLAASPRNHAAMMAMLK